jgi:glucokinase-like ROK family protein
LSTHAVHDVLELLCQHGTLGLGQIQRRTCLSRTTVSRVLSQLIEAGLVVEEHANGSGRPRGGRWTPQVAFSGSVGKVAGIDFGRNHVHVALADLALRVQRRASHAMPVADDGLAALSAAAAMVRRLLRAEHASESDLVGVGLALPGPLDLERARVSRSILPGWRDLRPGEEMSRRLGVPAVLENDANVGALGELVFGAARGHSHVIYILGTTGIGCGLILGGELYRGASGCAGEFGHMVVEPDGPVCETCGNRGCVDTVLSGRAIIEMLRSKRSFPESLSPENGLRWAIHEAKQGNLACQRAIHEVSRKLGALVANLCTVINPEVVVIGGPLGHAGDMVLDPIKEAIKWRALPTAAGAVEVTASRLGGRAEVLGALALVERGSSALVSSRLETLLAHRP